MIWVGRMLRMLAVWIAILGLVDPVLTWPRSDRPVVAVIDAGASSLATRLTTELARDFDVHTGPVAGSAATVLAGWALPAAPVAVSGALIAVTPSPVSPRVDIEHLSAPATSAPAASVPVDVALRAVGARGRTLRVDVSDGALLLDRTTHIVASDDERFAVTLSAPAIGTGVSRFVVRVRDDARSDASLTAEGVVATEATAVRWKVLVVDPRPSWASTFVRRALEADRRFDVSSRVTTSRAIDVESGDAPALLNAAALESFAAIVVGAPDALTVAEVRALEQFARGRGGAVVLLMDRVDAGPAARIAGAASWRDVHGIERRAVVGDAGTLIATELAVPETLLPGGAALATMGAGTAARPAVVWQTPLGAGRVIVSGALDAWRYRAREQNGFARFWTGVISDAAAAAPPAVMVMPPARVVAPGSDMDVRVIVRRAQLSDASRPAPLVDARARIGAVGASAAGADMAPLRLWPTAERGVFVAPVRMPAAPGTYRIVVDAVDDRGVAIGEAAVDVVAAELPPAPGVTDLAAWTTAHGGVVVPGAEREDVVAAVRARVSSRAEPQRVHPMRSPWWLPLFVGVLGGEWWLRRRRGDR